MLVAGYLGLQSLVLVAFLVFPAIGLVLRHKWRLGMARKEEIQRLLVLASEEATRVELEASFGYSTVPISRNSHCAVCNIPTNSRCARCRAVRYCSGKCQIIHWRQGHKDECHSPGTYDGPRGKDTSMELHANGKEKNSNSELPVTLFSDCVSMGSEASADASLRDSSSESGSPRSDGYFSAQTSFDKHNTSSGVSVNDPSKPLSPKVAHLIKSVDKLKTENHPKSIGIDPDCGNPPSEFMGTGAGGSYEGSVNEFYSVSSGFQGRIENSFRSRAGVCEDSVPSDINEANNRNSSESKSFMHFSFNLCGGISESNAQVVQVNEMVPTVLGINETTGSTLLADAKVESLKVKSSPSCYEGSQDTDDTAKESSDFQELNSIPSSSCINPFSISRYKSGSVRDSYTSTSASLQSERSFPVSIDPGKTSNMSKPRMIKSLSVDDSSAHFPLTVGGVSGHPIHSRRIGSIQINARLSSPDSNFFSNSVDGCRPRVQSELRRCKSEHTHVLHGSEVAGRYGDMGNFPYELFVNLYDWNKVELRPSGLINCGNSCYANAVLQCLAFTPPLTAYFLQGLHSKACANEGWCFTCEFESLVLDVKEGKSPLSPYRIISQLRKIGSQLVNGKEEDAHEFLRCAIDTMQSICFMEAQVSQSGTVEEETTLIGLTFGGYLLSEIKCTSCESKSERIEMILDLTVEISGDIGTIEEALQQYTSTEILDGKNRYQCSRCKSYVKAKKKLTILEAPNILTIALKRFQSGKFGKLNKPVVFSEILDLAPFLSGRSDKSSIYRLYGVIIHLDVLNATFSGHYICYIRNNQNKWFKIDDSTVTATDFESVLTRGAYMLFYARCSPVPPRLIRSKTAHDPKNTCIRSRINERNTSSKSSSNFTYPDSQNTHINYSSNDSANINSFYKKFRQLQKVLEDDSTSDISSLLSSNSDESSCSTNSTNGSRSTDDLSDYLYNGYGWNCLQNRSEVDSSSSSSSSSSPLLHHADSSQCAQTGVIAGEFHSSHPNHTTAVSSLLNRPNGSEKIVYMNHHGLAQMVKEI